MIETFFSFFPPALSTAWVLWVIFSIAALLGLVAVSSRFWFYDKSYRAAYLESKKPPPQIQLEQYNIANRNLKTLARIIPQQSLDETSSTNEEEDSVSIIVQVGDPKTVGENSVIQEMVLIYPDGNHTDFDFMVMSGRFSWFNLSSTQFEAIDGDPVGIEVALNKDYIRDFVSPSRVLYCFGFASSEKIDRIDKTNTELSDDRAINLCKAVSNLGFIDPSQPRVFTVGVGFGERVIQPDEKVSPSLQRSVVMVSVRDARGPVIVENIVQGLLADSDNNGLAIDRYQRDDGHPWQKYIVKPGELTGVAGTEWRDGNVNKAVSDALNDPSKPSE